MVGPVLLVHGHLVLFDHQDVEVRCSVHGVVQVEQAVLVAASGDGENRTLDAVWTLREAGSRRLDVFTWFDNKT